MISSTNRGNTTDPTPTSPPGSGSIGLKGEIKVTKRAGICSDVANNQTCAGNNMVPDRNILGATVLKKLMNENLSLRRRYPERAARIDFEMEFWRASSKALENLVKHDEQNIANQTPCFKWQGSNSG